MKQKKIVIIGLLIGVVLIAGIIIAVNSGRNTNEDKDKKLQNESINEEKYTQIFEDGTKINRSNKLKETKKIEGLEITESQLTYRNGTSKFIAKVTNTKKEDIGITPIEITLYDNQNKELEKIEGIISPIKAGQSIELNVGISKDYADAYDYSIKIK